MEQGSSASASAHDAAGECARARVACVPHRSPQLRPGVARSRTSSSPLLAATPASPASALGCGCDRCRGGVAARRRDAPRLLLVPSGDRWREDADGGGGCIVMEWSVCAHGGGGGGGTGAADVAWSCTAPCVRLLEKCRHDGDRGNESSIRRQTGSSIGSINITPHLLAADSASTSHHCSLHLNKPVAVTPSCLRCPG